MPHHTSRTRDFHFELPEDWIDRTMIAWSAPPLPGKPVTPNILIAYDALRDSEDLAGFVNRQLKELMSKARKFQLDLRRDTMLKGSKAIELIFHWDSGSGLLKQRQIYTLLPDGRALTLVNTASLADFDEAEAHFSAMVSSFAWNEPRP